MSPEISMENGLKDLFRSVYLCHFLGGSQTTFGAGNATQHCCFSNKYPVNENMLYLV